MKSLTIELDDRHSAALEALSLEQRMDNAAVLRQALRLYQAVHLRAKAGEELAFIKAGSVVPVTVPSMLPLLPPQPA